MGKRVVAFVMAWVVTYVLAVTAATQSVLAYLEALGREIAFGQRLSAIGHDLTAMVIPYGALILLAMLIAWGVVTLIVRTRPSLRLAGFVLGGFAAVMAIHLTLRLVFDMNPVWATGTPMGLIMQGLAGAVGGYVFFRANRLVPS
jgi:hypothetical protein